MNYLTEIKLFYDWLETHPLSAPSIALWHGLIFIANRSGWRESLSIPLSSIESRTSIPRASIYRERDRLQKAGLISYQTMGGKASAVYKIISLEKNLVSQNMAQIESQSDSLNENPSQISDLDSHLVSQNSTDFENIYKLNYTEINKEKQEKEFFGDDSCEAGEKEKSCAKKEKEGKKSRKMEIAKVDISAVLAKIESPWAELMRSWLEYKRVRRESYRSEIGVAKCLSLLRHLAGNDPKTAAAIIDQSIANNWAGLFELKRSGYGARGQPGQPPQPATGQHIGQIKQPDSEERTRKLLEKFNQK